MKPKNLEEALNTIKNSDAKKIIEKHLLIDYQTGTLNRRGFDKKLEEALSRKDRQKIPFSMAFTDLYHLSEYNDTDYKKGDQALQQLATILQKELRPTDSVARLGEKSDEFRILLPGLQQKDHQLYLHRMKTQILRAPRILEHIPFHAYWGIAEYTNSTDKLYEALDTQLRKEKAYWKKTE